MYTVAVANKGRIKLRPKMTKNRAKKKSLTYST